MLELIKFVGDLLELFAEGVGRFVATGHGLVELPFKTSNFFLQVADLLKMASDIAFLLSDRCLKAGKLRLQVLNDAVPCEQVLLE